MVDKVARYNLLSEFCHSPIIDADASFFDLENPVLSKESCDLHYQYVQMQIEEILEERRNTKGIIAWVRQKIFPIPSPLWRIPADILQEANNRASRDVFEFLATKRKLTAVINGWFTQAECDLAKINDIYNQHKNPPKKP